MTNQTGYIETLANETCSDVSVTPDLWRPSWAVVSTSYLDDMKDFRTNCTDLNGNYKNTKINLQEDKK